MKKVKPKNSLLRKLCVSDLIVNVSGDVKVEFQNLDFNTLRRDRNAILYLMERVNEYVDDQEKIDKKVAKKLDKNLLVVEIVKMLFPNITAEEIKEIEEVIQDVLDNKLIKKHKNFFLRITKPIRWLVMYFLR
jgi:hypothetical protein